MSRAPKGKPNLTHILTGREQRTSEGFAYSSCVVVGDIVYVSGHTSGRSVDGAVVGAGDIEKQVQAVFENLRQTLTAAGAEFRDVAKISVYLTRADHRNVVNVVAARYLPQPPPASTLVVVSALADPAFMVEIDAVAVRGKTEPASPSTQVG